jgi:two-component system nitrate/nitrite response regulator NarL
VATRVLPTAQAESAEELLRKLVRMSPAGRDSSTPAAADRAETVLRANIDGREYTLICSAPKLPCHLSPREQEVVRLVAQGLPNKCISAVLEISTWTVATHLRRIFAKLGVSSRAAMVARVLG